jgi:hypothetical protein
MRPLTATSSLAVWRVSRSSETSLIAGNWCTRMLERRRGPVPVFGMNLGTVGFLMNEWRSYGLEDRLARVRVGRCGR